MGARRRRFRGGWVWTILALAAQSNGAPTPVSLAPSGSGGSTGRTASAGDLDGRWTIRQSGSFVGYRVREKLAFLSAPSDAVGRTSAVRGRLTVAGLRVEAVDVSADLRRLQSNEARRDARIHTQGLASDRFPTARFVLTTPVSFDAVPRQGATVKVEATGDFTLHGVTRRVTITLQARWNGDTMEVAGGFPVTFSDYGVTAPSFGGFVSVQDHGTVELHLVFARA
jgi:polyisoprenoid-binding protein YceI